ncbi:aldolase catalytic domain-containing protein [Methylovulum miyakonense]|uniref:aldolase catalytic domain-containing protein n=1 Tax=Methylovulum miyakonense TaxID=645578 RepID=UPI00035D5E3F|nr:aldolase catalytic domain-containing protein [Methylovulum miyakonense]
MKLDFKLINIDCTLRDGGYYNQWDFSQELIHAYLDAMEAAGVDFVELGFRSFDKNGFRGACAYTTDDFINSLTIPPNIKIGVMMNASELINHPDGPLAAIKLQFVPAKESPVTLIRFACHVHEFEATLPMCAWLKQQGYLVGINLMQVADRSETEIEHIGKVASHYDLDALYFADSMGSLEPHQAAAIVKILKRHWQGAMGIHTHDNMGRAMANTLSAINEGVTWVDSTVTGMGRGPGNVQTEYVLIELANLRAKHINLSPLLELIRKHFKPMQDHYGWGANPYYYLAGKYGIHPTYIQKMLSDSRFGEAEILSVIDHLKAVGGKKFSTEIMEAGRQVYGGEQTGSWAPEKIINGREVLIVAAGPSVGNHRRAIEQYIVKASPFVIGLNTQKTIDENLIDVRAACHPFRLLADCDQYPNLKQPLVVPSSRLPEVIKASMEGVNQFDFGLSVEPARFEFHDTYAIAPTSLVVAYALAIATSGKAARVLMAGFDGFSADDPRTTEMEELLANYQSAKGASPILAVTPTRYKIPSTSIYAL